MQTKHVNKVWFNHLIQYFDLDVVKYVNEIRIDGDVFYTDVNDNAKDYTNMEVYASNEFDDSFEGILSKVNILTEISF